LEPDASPAIRCPLTCGPNANSDCCESLPVPGGTFYRDYDVATDGRWNDMGHPATVSDFRLDKYEVTVGRFRAFVESGVGPRADGVGAHERIPGSGWDTSWETYVPHTSGAWSLALACDSTFATWTDSAGPNENRPINCVSWYEAFAFCIWDGGYLPTAAEWNYAASGGNEQRAYPWSNPPGSLDIDYQHASYYDSIGSRACYGDRMDGCAITDLVPAGSKPLGDGRWGHSELAGNVDEWALDWATSFTKPTYVDPCVDCANLLPSPDDGHVRRGGYFQVIAQYSRSADRGFGWTDRSLALGFRCARAP
jgi:formylglycine-generating enzyme required for sulfatase activity